MIVCMNHANRLDGSYTRQPRMIGREIEEGSGDHVHGEGGSDGGRH